MRGFTIEGTAFGKPYPTALEGIGLLNFSMDDQREIELASRAVTDHARDVAGPAIERVDADAARTDEYNAATDKEREKLPDPPTVAEVDEGLEAMRQALDEQQELLFAHTFAIVTKALCLTETGEPIPDLNTVDDLKRAGEVVRRRLHRAYSDAMAEVGNSP